MPSHASTHVERAVLQGVDLLIINKFGREEAHGRGLRPVRESALACSQRQPPGSIKYYISE